MNLNQKIILILSIILFIQCILSMWYDLDYVGWAVYFSWLSSIFSLMSACILFIGLFRPVPIKSYRFVLGILIFSDIISLIVMIIFFVYGYFNWPKLLAIIFITPLIIFVHLLIKEISLSGSQMTVPLNAPVAAPMNAPVAAPMNTPMTAYTTAPMTTQPPPY